MQKKNNTNDAELLKGSLGECQNPISSAWIETNFYLEEIPDLKWKQLSRREKANVEQKHILINSMCKLWSLFQFFDFCKFIKHVHYTNLYTRTRFKTTDKQKQPFNK